jgi:hypothetical protein
MDISEIQLLLNSNFITMNDLSNLGIKKHVLERFLNYQQVFFPNAQSINNIGNERFASSENNILFFGPFQTGKTALISNLLGYLNEHGWIRGFSNNGILELIQSYSQGFLPTSNHHSKIFKFDIELQINPLENYRLSIFEIDDIKNNGFAEFDDTLSKHFVNNTILIIVIPVDFNDKISSYHNSINQILHKFDVKSVIFVRSKFDLILNDLDNMDLFNEILLKFNHFDSLSNKEIQTINYSVGPLVFEKIYQEEDYLNGYYNKQLFDKIISNMIKM